MSGSPLLALWGWPVVLTTLSALGLLGALWGDGIWDVLGWIGLGLPAGTAVWFGLRGRRAPPR